METKIPEAVKTNSSANESDLQNLKRILHIVTCECCVTVGEKLNETVDAIESYPDFTKEQVIEIFRHSANKLIEQGKKTHGV
jgi:hypothetical protein